MIKQATLHDVPALLEIENASFVEERFNRRQYRYLITKAQGQVLVAEEGGQVVGCAVLNWRRRDRHSWVTSIAVAPSHRHMGIASRLLASVEQVARAQGLSDIRLTVRASNTPAIRLYEKAGYSVTKRLPSYYGGEDGLSLVKPL